MTMQVGLSTREYAENARFQRSWNWYDWANSAFVTTTGTVLFGPYLNAIAREAACPGLAEGATCTTNLSLLGIPIDPGSVASYVTTAATIISAVVLIFIGAIADRSPRPARLLGLFAWPGALCASLIYFVTGTNWQLGAVLMVLATLFLGASLIVYNAILVRISHPDDRDKVSAKAWAWGYLGGGILLALNLVLVTMHDTFGMSQGMAVRVSMLSAGLWWGIFTVIPVVGMRQLKGAAVSLTERSAGVVSGSVGQLVSTFREMKDYPQTVLFLGAYLFFNDGIQTVIASSSIYGAQELQFSESQLITLILMVQFVAFGGALLFGKIAGRHGAHKTILWSLVAWTAIVAVAYFVPAGAFGLFMALGVFIAIVLGGSQALSRSLFSQLVPLGREAEFFSFYQAMERGTSWLGTLTFGLVHQFTHSYRLSIVALIAFFVIGGLLLRKVDIRQGILDAGNELPKVI